MIKQMKKSNGITLTMLVITIIVLVILLSTSVAAINIVKTAREQSIRANMLLIQTKVKIINEQVNFNGDTSVYIGDKLMDKTDKELIVNGMLNPDQLTDNNWYIYDRDTLDIAGLEGIKLGKNEVYLVNYITTEVISPSNKMSLPGYENNQIPPTGDILIEESPTTWTNGNVTVTVNYPTLAGTTKQYKIGQAHGQHIQQKYQWQIMEQYMQD